jgi:hypothetical protein
MPASIDLTAATGHETDMGAERVLRDLSLATAIFVFTTRGGIQNIRK